MLIKEYITQKKVINILLVYLRKLRFRYYVISLFIVILIVAVGIGGIYYGTKLYGSENSSVYSSFYRFFRPSFNMVEHYFEGLLSQPEELRIHLKHLDYQKLAHRVENARKKGGITREEKAEEVNAFIEHNGKKYDIKIRLKGLFLDHLRGDKWSFRIRVKDNKTIFGMSRFSLHSPETRGHIHEWVFQKALQTSSWALISRFNF